MEETNGDRSPIVVEFWRRETTGGFATPRGRPSFSSCGGDGGEGDEDDEDAACNVAYLYDVFGDGARLVARDFYKSSVVDARSGGVTLSERMFALVCADLLFRRGCFVEVWVSTSPPRGGTGTLLKRATPGYWHALERELSSHRPLTVEQESGRIATVVVVRNESDDEAPFVGLAIADPEQRSILVRQFLDTRSLTNLQSALATEAVPVVEQVLANHNHEEDGDAALRQNAHRALTLMGSDKTSTHLVSIQQRSKQELIARVRRHVMCRGGGDEAFHMVSAEPVALAAADCLVQHLGPLGDLGKWALLTSAEGDSAEGDFLLFDAAVSKALCVFPGDRGATDDDSDRFAAEGIVSGINDPSLFSVINATLTVMGARRLRRWLRLPTRAVARINERHACVQALIDDPQLLRQLRSAGAIKGCPDLATLSQKFASWQDEATASRGEEEEEGEGEDKTATRKDGVGPRRRRLGLRDLLAVYACSQNLQRVAALLKKAASLSQDNDAENPAVLSVFHGPVVDADASFVKFRALVEQVVDFGVLRVRPSFDGRLQRLATAMADVDARIEAERKAIANTMAISVARVKLEWGGGASSLGGRGAFCLRVTARDRPLLRRMSAMVLSVQRAGVLFETTTTSVLSAERRRTVADYEAIQREVVDESLSVASTFHPVMSSAADLLGRLDVLAGFASVAKAAAFVRPRMVGEDEECQLQLVAARHPAVDAALGSRYVPNDIRMCRKTSRLHIVTGPNASGKSTLIRCVAAIALLAQAGSFVPCDRAVLPVFSSLHARVGASDCLQRGVSTFMMEMLETQAILQRANSRSLVVIDELGRGTSAEDGFGIAWAVAQHLLERTRCLCLFATHFHELSGLVTCGTGATNVHMAVDVRSDGTGSVSQMSLLFQARPGICTQSCGIHTARASGLPSQIIDDALRMSDLLAADDGGKSSGSSSSSSEDDLTGRASTGEDGAVGRVSDGRNVARMSRQGRGLPPCGRLPQEGKKRSRVEFDDGGK